MSAILACAVESEGRPSPARKWHNVLSINSNLMRREDRNRFAIQMRLARNLITANEEIVQTGLPLPVHFSELLKFGSRDQFFSLLDEFIPGIRLAQWSRPHSSCTNKDVLSFVAEAFNDLQMQVASGQDKPANAVGLIRALS